jgi:hypothetical protein
MIEGQVFKTLQGILSDKGINGSLGRQDAARNRYM